jgi:hypothetical protein
MSRYAQPHAHLRAAPVTGAAEAVSQVAIALRRRPARKSRDTHWLRFHCGDTYTGAGGDPGIANMWNRKEISVIVPRRTGHIAHQHQEVGLVRRRLAAHAHGGTQHKYICRTGSKRRGISVAQLRFPCVATHCDWRRFPRASIDCVCGGGSWYRVGELGRLST